MTWMLVEIRGIVPPLLTKLVNEPDEDFLNGLDIEFEMLIRSNGKIIEIYKSGKWEPIPEL